MLFTGPQLLGLLALRHIGEHHADGRDTVENQRAHGLIWAGTVVLSAACSVNSPRPAPFGRGFIKAAKSVSTSEAGNELAKIRTDDLFQRRLDQ